MPTRDINDVLRAHDDGLLAIPGVVGVYVGLMDHGKTPCLTVMVTRRTSEVERKIPDTIEGYPVCIEESGVIRPLRKGGRFSLGVRSVLRSRRSRRTAPRSPAFPTIQA